MKMRFATIVGALALITFAVPAAAQQAPTRVGYLRTDSLLANAPGMAQVQQQLRTELAPFEQRLRMLEDSARVLQQKLSQEALGLSQQAREERQAQYQQQVQALQQQAAEAQQQGAQRQSELLGPVMQRIEEAISAVRQEGGFAILLDASGEAIVSADTTLDVTQQVLARLRAAGAGNP